MLLMSQSIESKLSSFIKITPENPVLDQTFGGQVLSFDISH